DAATREALAGVVVRVADQVEGEALGQEGAEALATRAFELDEDALVRQPLGMAADQLARQHRAHRAVHVAGLFHELHLLAALERGPALLDQLLVEGLREAVVLLLALAARHL